MLVLHGVFVGDFVLVCGVVRPCAVVALVAGCPCWALLVTIRLMLWWVWVVGLVTLLVWLWRFNYYVGLYLLWMLVIVC